MQTPTIIVAVIGPDQYEISVSGRFGGGFQGLRTNRNGVLQRIGHLKSYDCGKEPAGVVVPPDLEPEFRKVFPKSFPST
jgi:hypothetical protein